MKVRASLRAIGSQTMTKEPTRLPFGLSLETLRSYAALLTGQVGRLVFSLIYFLALMKALTLAEFGMFATASAIGVTLSRVAAFGFVSPLYRTSCVRRRLLGSYIAGYGAALLLSLPLCAAIAWAAHAALYGEGFALSAFACIMVAEIILWRTSEVLVIVANGLNRFLRGSLVVIFSTATRAAAALLLVAHSSPDLAVWSFHYLVANAVVLAVSLVVLLPRARPRWTPGVWIARWRDALGVAGAELVFYAQSELDRVLVLAVGGPAMAGLYSVLLRLADFTAIPLRSLMTLLIQAIMRARGRMRARGFWIGLEAAIFAVSALAMGALAILAGHAPPSLGENVALAAGFLPLALLLPGFRNLVELHTELLYAFERPVERLVQLIGVGLSKAALLILLLAQVADFAPFVWWLNALFATLYAISALYTYRTLASQPRVTDPRPA